jgi:hypothetical protein
MLSDLKLSFQKLSFTHDMTVFDRLNVFLRPFMELNSELSVVVNIMRQIIWHFMSQLSNALAMFAMPDE